MEGPTGKRYIVRSIADLLNIPKDRRTVCLAELEGWLNFVEQDLLINFTQSIGPFIWIDDGMGGITKEGRYLEKDALLVGPGYEDSNVNDSTPRFRDLSVAEQYRRLK